MRNIIIAGLFILSLGTSAIAEFNNAPLKRILPYLVDYVEMPSVDKTHFKITHRISSNEPMSEPIRLWVYDGEREVDLLVAEDGVVDWHPIADLLSDDLVLYTNIARGSGSISLSVDLLLPITTEYAVEDMALAIDQANRSIKANAGVLRFLAPKMKALAIVVPEGTTASIVDADGVQTAFEKNDDGFFVVKPKKRRFKNARAIVFSASPLNIGFVD